MDESEDIQRIKQRDWHGLEMLIERYQQRAVRAAYLVIGDQTEAEDVVAEAFYRVWRQIDQFDNTRPFAPWFFRMMGCKIGKRVYMETTEITEFDLVKMGDDSVVNDNCTLQTHLFEDRVMKMSYVDIGKNCSVGGMSTVLYDSKMEDDSILEPLSVLMKSETLPAGNCFVGAPAIRTEG